jgi:DNA polymerase I
MDRILLIDGNSILFRAYYASNYGALMRTSQGVETNAVFTFANMLMKALEVLKPTHVLVAFDSGVKGVRNDWFPEYKGTRKELDPSLVSQFPLVREFLDAADIVRHQLDGIEADDIIGSMAHRFPGDEVMILTSDKDLLQLIDTDITVYLMKTGITDLLKMDLAALAAQYNLVPQQIVDLKSLMGDPSDNIPGVMGVGEKTALKLLADHGSLTQIYNNIDLISGKLKDKLIDNKAQAFMSYQLATIFRDVEVDINKSKLLLKINNNQLRHFYNKYEMKSLAAKLLIEDSKDQWLPLSVVEHLPDISGRTVAMWMDTAHFSQNEVFGFVVTLEDTSYYLTIDSALHDVNFIELLNSNQKKWVYDVKRWYHLLQGMQLSVNNLDDLMIVAFLCDNNLNDWDKLLGSQQITLSVGLSEVYGSVGKPLYNHSLALKLCNECAQTVSRLAKTFFQQLIEYQMLDLYQQVELPLAGVLFRMEQQGIKTDITIMRNIAENMRSKLDGLSQLIYDYALHEFNINSPKQLGEVLFDEMGLKANKKRSTNVDELEKIAHLHPIVNLILEYRTYQKIYSTYAEGLQKFIGSDGKIHTIYQQCLAATGRLSSTEPNLQNISVRNEEAREIRKAFVPEFDYLLSCDYSQVELRILADLADEEHMIEVFQNHQDIHTTTAMAIFSVSEDQVTSQMRRTSKAVNFGIVYGISDFGLAAQLGISRKEAQQFIDNYLDTYPKIQLYMDRIIQQCQKDGYVKTILNRRRYIPEINDKNYAVREFGKRAAMNAPIQGSAADLIKLAMLRIDEKITEQQLVSKLILSVHDELVFDVKADELNALIVLVQNAMNQAMQLKVDLEVSIAYAKDWYGAK